MRLNGQKWCSNPLEPLSLLALQQLKGFESKICFCFKYKFVINQSIFKEK